MKFGDKDFFLKTNEQTIDIPAFLYEGTELNITTGRTPRCTCSNCMTTEEIYDPCTSPSQMPCTCSGESNMCTCSGQSNQCTCSGQNDQGCSHNWVTNHHEAGASGCSSGGGTAHPHPMHDKCSKCGICRSNGSNASWTTTTTCVTTGCWDNARCSRCDKLLSNPEHHHSGGAAATCTTGAKCKCGKTETSGALGHNFSNGVCIRPGCGVADPNFCKHPNATWSAWKPHSSNALKCYREKYCPASSCKKVVETESKDHSFKHNGQYQAYSATHHTKVGYCGDCSFSPLGYLEAHSFVGGICVCGASSGGGGSTGTPSISSFTAVPNVDGMSIKCSVSATNAVRYIFNLYDAGTTMLVTTSGSTTSTSYTFSCMPETSYIVAVDAINGIGVVTKKSVNVTTPKAIPKEFRWKTQPQTGNEFSISVTSTEWETLQNTVNAWRKYYKLATYEFVQHQNNDTSFSVAYKDADYTYRFFNQIINGISTIPKFNGSLPSKLSTNPRKWLASDFVKFQTAVNSLKNTIG